MNPFTEDVFSGNLVSEPTYGPLYSKERAQLLRLIRSAGRRRLAPKNAKGLTALVRSEKAGAGKSHFLAAFAADHRSEAHFCTIPLVEADTMNWTEWFRDVLFSLHDQRDAASGGTALTHRTALLFSSVTSDLIAKGKIPCDAPAAAAAWLSENGSKLFDHAEAGNPSVAWLRDNMDEILPELAQAEAQAAGSDVNATKEWMAWLFDYAQLSASPDSVEGRRHDQRTFLESSDLVRAVADEARARSALRLLGRLLTKERPLCLIFDDLDWFYRDEASALRLARMISELSTLIPASVTIISINDDIWEETFVRGLPNAVLDRLTTHTYALKGLSTQECRAFLLARCSHHELAHGTLESVSAEVEEALGGEEHVTPRVVLREAGRAWDDLIHDDIVESAPLPETNEPDDQRAPEPMKAEAEIEEPVSEKKPVAAQAPTGPHDPEAASSWSNALGDVRDLIRQRGQSAAAPERRSPFTAVQPQSASPEPSQPAPGAESNKPELTPEFRSFLASLRARAEDKQGYMPQPQGPSSSPVPAEQTLSGNGHPSSPEIDPTPFSDPVVVPKPGPQMGPFTPSPNQEDPSIQSRLRSLKVDYVTSNVAGQIDLDRLRTLIETGGYLFPAILQEFPQVTGEASPDVRWRYQQNEVNFAFRPYRDQAYWRALVEAIAGRARLTRERDKSRVKLVVFALANDEEVFPSWKVTEEEALDLQFCDVVILTESHLATLYAVEQLLAAEPDADKRESIFMKTSGDLDFFWKMITRPVWTLVSQFSRGAKAVGV